MAQLNSTAVTPNISSSLGPHTSLDASSLVPIVVMSMCFLLGFPGNIAVIILRPNWENMSRLSQSLMLNLAVSDLLCMLTIPVWIYAFLSSWTLGLVPCKLISYFVYCSIYASLLTVTVLSIQRYLQVVYFERSLHQVGARKLLVPLWLAAMILSIPELVVRKLVEDQQWIKCKTQHSSKAQRLAVVLTETLVGSASVSVIVFTYISLYRKVTRAAFFNNPQTTRLITSIIVIFVVHWVPYLLINVLAVAAVSLENDGLLKFCDESWYTVAALTFVNSALNPVLYAFTFTCVSTVCQKMFFFIQNIRITPNLSRSADMTTEVTFQ